MPLHRNFPGESVVMKRDGCGLQRKCGQRARKPVRMQSRRVCQTGEIGQNSTYSGLRDSYISSTCCAFGEDSLGHGALKHLGFVRLVRWGGAWGWVVAADCASWDHAFHATSCLDLCLIGSENNVSNLMQRFALLLVDLRSVCPSNSL